MRRILSVLLILSLCLALFGCSKPASETVKKDHIFAEMTIKDYGTIKLELYPEKAPVTVDNFVNLVNSGFYTNMPIHRIQKGFVVQAGDSQYTDKGSVSTIKGEFSDNGVTNDLAHTRGALSMARQSGNNDSASSQFFICIGDCRSSLDGKYACFGYVTEGMDIIDRMVALSAGTLDMGFIGDLSKMPVIESIKIIGNTEG